MFVDSFCNHFSFPMLVCLLVEHISVDSKINIIFDIVRSIVNVLVNSLLTHHIFSE